MKTNIGIEIHIELNSKYKMFSSAPNYKNLKQNTNMNPVDNGEPGTMPTINIECVKKAILLGQSLGMSLNNKLIFERKNYFYFDLPKGFQITQKNEPIAKNGKVTICLDGYKKDIFIEQIQIEEDTAKQINNNSEIYLDFNRCGSPLIELITTPCFSNYTEVVEFIKIMILHLRELNISSAKMEEGSLRVDVNISVSKTNVLGNRIEIKNLNSLNNIKKAIVYEENDLIKLLTNDNKTISYTKNFNEATNTNIILRRKMENSQYVFIREPNLPIIDISELIKESVNKINRSFFNKYYLLNKYKVEKNNK